MTEDKYMRTLYTGLLTNAMFVHISNSQTALIIPISIYECPVGGKKK
jgi:hypothetical protein